MTNPERPAADPEVEALDSIRTIRDLERALRAAGLSSIQAKVTTARFVERKPDDTAPGDYTPPAVNAVEPICAPAIRTELDLARALHSAGLSAEEAFAVAARFQARHDPRIMDAPHPLRLFTRPKQ